MPPPPAVAVTANDAATSPMPMVQSPTTAITANSDGVTDERTTQQMNQDLTNLKQQHAQERTLFEHNYTSKLNALTVEANEARELASTKAAQYEHAAKRAHQQVLLISSELGRAERAVEAQRELCDHLTLEMKNTSLELINQQHVYEYNMNILQHEKELEMSTNMYDSINLKRKLLKFKLKDYRTQDAIKRMKREHKRHVSTSARNVAAATTTMGTVTKELDRTYHQYTNAHKTIVKANQTIESLNNNVEQNKATIITLNQTMKQEQETSQVLESNVASLQNELATAKVNHETMTTAMNKMKKEMIALEEEKATLLSEQMDLAVQRRGNEGEAEDEETRQARMQEKERLGAKQTELNMKLQKKCDKQSAKIIKLKDALRKFKKLIKEPTVDEVEEEVAVMAEVEQEKVVAQEKAVAQEEETHQEEEAQVVAPPPSSTKKRKKTKSNVEEEEKEEEEPQPKKKRKKKTATKAQTNASEIYVEEEPEPKDKVQKSRNKTKKPLSARKNTKKRTVSSTEQEEAVAPAPVDAAASKPKPKRKRRKLKTKKNTSTLNLFKTVVDQTGGVVPKLKNAKLKKENAKKNSRAV
jgi:hypothetical protein